jgi:hypothetical protein
MQKFWDVLNRRERKELSAHKAGGTWLALVPAGVVKLTN